MLGRFRQEALESAALPELAGAGIGSVIGELRRNEHGIHAGFGYLLGQELTVAHVARKRCAMAVEEHHDNAGPAHVETGGDVDEDTVVAVAAALGIGAADPPWCGKRKLKNGMQIAMW